MMQALIDSLSCILTWIGQAFTQLFVDAFEFISDALVFVFDKAGDIVISAFQTFDFTEYLEILLLWNFLPPNAIHVISAIGLPQAIGIVTSAIVIRFFLQLIPFVRLGS